MLNGRACTIPSSILSSDCSVSFSDSIFKLKEVLFFYNSKTSVDKFLVLPGLDHSLACCVRCEPEPLRSSTSWLCDHPAQGSSAFQLVLFVDVSSAEQNCVVPQRNATELQKVHFWNIALTEYNTTSLGGASRQPTPEARSHRLTSLRSQYAAEYRSNHQL